MTNTFGHSNNSNDFFFKNCLWPRITYLAFYLCYIPDFTLTHTSSTSSNTCIQCLPSSYLLYIYICNVYLCLWRCHLPHLYIYFTDFGVIFGLMLFYLCCLLFVYLWCWFPQKPYRKWKKKSLPYYLRLACVYVCVFLCMHLVSYDHHCHKKRLRLLWTHFKYVYNYEPPPYTTKQKHEKKNILCVHPETLDKFCNNILIT